MNNILTTSKKWIGLVLLLIVALAAFFRIYQLGESAFRADTMLFFDLCHRPVSAWVIFTRWLELLGSTAQFPFSLAITKLFIDVFQLAPSAFMIRLPNAVFGVLTVAAMYMLGRQMAGRVFGLALALWLAVNPFHIQLSREAYFYAATLLGVTLQGWACLWAFRHRRRAAAFPVSFHVINQIGFLFIAYSHVSGWWVGAPLAFFFALMLGRRAWLDPSCRRDFWIWLLASVISALPLLFMDWALPYFIKESLSDEGRANVKRIFGERREPLFSFAWRFMTNAAWGGSPPRVLFLVLTGVLALASIARRNLFRRGGILAACLLVSFGIYTLSLVSTGAYYAQRHVSFLLPLYLALLAYGAWHVSALPYMRALVASPVWRRVPAYVLAAIAVAFSLQPAWLCTQLTGKPIPYKDIARWCDTQLPPRTLVLVERWLDPWNELRVHNSTNVYFTFTVPAEPQDVFERNNWPATAKEFFTHFPDAAYLEYVRSARNMKGVVTNVYFARSVTFTNLAAIKLGKIGVAYRDEFSNPAADGMIATVFYNTRDDVIRHAREQGRTTLVLYEPSWGYVKLWQQLRDFRDWRILEDQAALAVYNLTPQTNTAALLIRGMAINGAKRVRCGMFGQADFNNMQLAEWRLDRVPLAPGLNRIVLTDQFWSAMKIPLLVDRVEVLPDGASKK